VLDVAALTLKNAYKLSKGEIPYPQKKHTNFTLLPEIKIKNIQRLAIRES